MSPRRRGRAGPEETREAPAEEVAAEQPVAEPAAAVAEVAPDDIHTVDLVSDELGLARAQLDAGLPTLAEGTVRRRIAVREADDTTGDDELDALRVLLAEAFWRQGRLVGARASLDAVRPGSPQRRLPIVLLVEAESLAAAGEPDRAAGALERVITAIGVEGAHELRAGVPGRLTWPLPAELLPTPTRSGPPPWSSAASDEPAEPPTVEESARTAAAHVRLEESRVAYVAGDLERGDAEMSIAVRLERALAGEGVKIIEPTLGGQPGADRLLLYGDLLRAAGRRVEADRAYDRAADRQG